MLMRCLIIEGKGGRLDYLFSENLPQVIFHMHNMHSQSIAIILIHKVDSSFLLVVAVERRQVGHWDGVFINL
ncbi:hypothetical protein AAHA92_27378 [Salvia divinorum]|uniref:Uncharacterized protein n=1 Tax=Salvia divinorum TaxID=28513 RepID=A0ABD1G3L2_SALDI